MSTPEQDTEKTPFVKWASGLFKGTVSKLLTLGVLVVIGAIIDVQYLKADVKDIKQQVSDEHEEKVVLKKLMCIALNKLDSIEQKSNPDHKKKQENLCIKLIN